MIQRLRNLFGAARNAATGTYSTVQVRLGTSDARVLQQVFIDREYDSAELPATASTVVDLGANVGFAAVFFALRYPNCRLLAVEPEASNFVALVANTANFGARITRLQAAAWTRDGTINLRADDDQGVFLDHWGVQVSETTAPGGLTTPCLRLVTMFDRMRFDEVDILKIDIEGAELELFSEGADAWLPRVHLIIIETHDRFRPGSDQAVRQALATRFEERPSCGENLFFRRR